MSSPSPSSELNPAAIAASPLDDDFEDDALDEDGGSDDAAFAVAVTVTVAVVVAVNATLPGAVDVITTVVVSVLLVDVEPDVRLLITSPASTENGRKLPLVPFKHVLLNGFMLPQQNKRSPSTSTRFMACAPLILTATLSAWRTEDAQIFA